MCGSAEDCLGDVTVGRGGIVHGGCAIIGLDGGTVIVGDRVTIFPGTVIEARGSGAIIEIGHDVEIGPGSITLRANRAGSQMTIGDGARISGFVELMGSSSLGTGTQVFGSPLTLVGASLEAGETWRCPDPGARGAVAKGCGKVIDLSVARGCTAVCGSVSSHVEMVAQRTLHP